MYKVIKYFTDLQDNNFSYNAGDTFPRDGLEVSKERIVDLATANNKQNTSLITFVEEEIIKEILDNQDDVDKGADDQMLENEEVEKVAPKKPTSKK